MRIDDFMPVYDVHERHSITIGAPPSAAYRAVQEVDFAEIALLRALLAIRMFPSLLLHPRRTWARRHERLTLEALAAAGFGRLADEPDRELVLGVTGRFWRPVRNVEPFERAAFDRPVPPGYARAVWNFTLTPDGAATVLGTETRIRCGDAASRRKFRAYWLLVGGFSGLVRRLLLAHLRRRCERG